MHMVILHFFIEDDIATCKKIIDLASHINSTTVKNEYNGQCRESIYYIYQHTDGQYTVSCNKVKLTASFKNYQKLITLLIFGDYPKVNDSTPYIDKTVIFSKPSITFKKIYTNNW